MEVTGDLGKSSFNGAEGTKAWLDWVEGKKLVYEVWPLEKYYSGLGEKDARDYGDIKYCQFQKVPGSVQESETQNL